VRDRLLILSDGKPGHLNQSIAFAKHLGYDYDVVPVRFRNRAAKALSYLADRLHLSLDQLFHCEAGGGGYKAVVSAGSETYYPNRVIAKQRGIKSVAIMLPQGYRYDFDLIVAQQHDNPPEQKNVISLPINLAYVEPQGLVTAEESRKYVSFIIGGDSKQGRLEPELLRHQLTQIFELFSAYDFWLTTSRRTSEDVEKVLREFDWSWAVYFSEEQVNPIPDFISQSDYLFLTSDSSSMISEAVSSGTAYVEILSSSSQQSAGGKFSMMLDSLLKSGAVHLFAGDTGKANRKINLAVELGKVKL
jgi:mitochondrial fission protein ELM1